VKPEMKTVLIIQAQMKQYRAPFFAKLYERLRGEGIALTVAYSAPAGLEAEKRDSCELPAEYGLKVRKHCLWRAGLMYQPLLQKALRSDLVIVEQANRYVLNHLLLPLSRAGVKRVAFWGHGMNPQQEQNSFSEWYRRKTLTWVSWWFAYTKGTASYLESQGFPVSRISAVQNSVDTREIQEHVNKSAPDDRTARRAQLDIPGVEPTGIFCGALDKSKDLPFLLNSCEIIKSAIPGFQLILVGAGREQLTIQRQIEGRPWVHWVGPQFGSSKAEFLSMADVCLLPCAVGLAILDAFAAGLPLFTTRHSSHGPEIEYLEEGVNGLMTAHRTDSYAKAVISVFEKKDSLLKLRDGAKKSAEKYSIENMTRNFAEGIQSCLELTGAGRRVLGLQSVD
jgi:L-malate glycosyltransferase